MKNCYYTQWKFQLVLRVLFTLLQHSVYQQCSQKLLPNCTVGWKAVATRVIVSRFSNKMDKSNVR